MGTVPIWSEHIANGQPSIPTTKPAIHAAQRFMTNPPSRDRGLIGLIGVNAESQFDAEYSCCGSRAKLAYTTQSSTCNYRLKLRQRLLCNRRIKMLCSSTRLRWVLLLALATGSQFCCPSFAAEKA